MLRIGAPAWLQWEAEPEKYGQRWNGRGVFARKVKQLGWREGLSRGVPPEKAGERPDCQMEEKGGSRVKGLGEQMGRSAQRL